MRLELPFFFCRFVFLFVEIYDGQNLIEEIVIGDTLYDVGL